MRLAVTFAILASLAAPLASCSAPWNAMIINDLSVDISLRTFGPGKCTTYGPLGRSSSLALQCDLRRGVRIDFANPAGKRCVVNPGEVARHVTDEALVDVWAHIWGTKYEQLRLSRLACDA